MHGPVRVGHKRSRCNRDGAVTIQQQQGGRDKFKKKGAQPTQANSDNSLTEAVKKSHYFTVTSDTACSVSSCCSQVQVDHQLPAWLHLLPNLVQRKPGKHTLKQYLGMVPSSFLRSWLAVCLLLVAAVGVTAAPAGAPPSDAYQGILPRDALLDSYIQFLHPSIALSAQQSGRDGRTTVTVTAVRDGGMNPYMPVSSPETQGMTFDLLDTFDALKV